MARKLINMESLENEEQYQQIIALNHEHLVAFIKKELAKRNFIIHLFVLFNIAFFTITIIFAIKFLGSGTLSFWKMFICWFLGLIGGSSLVIPFHEGIHGAVYYLLGAPKVKYGWNPQHFFFYAAADRFVMKNWQMWPLAISPFLIISSLSIFLLGQVSPSWQFFLWGLILMHSLNCIGDFGILSFVWSNRKEELYYFDKTEINTFYIYKKINNNI